MKRHLLSFLRSPLGYACNAIASAMNYITVPSCIERLVCAGCETFCPKDDPVQNDPLF